MAKVINEMKKDSSKVRIPKRRFYDDERSEIHDSERDDAIYISKKLKSENNEVKKNPKVMDNKKKYTDMISERNKSVDKNSVKAEELIGWEQNLATNANRFRNIK